MQKLKGNWMTVLSLQKKRSIIRATTVCGIILTIVGSYVITQSNYFKPGGGFNLLLTSLGLWAPLIFILLQISQTIYPIIPFGLTNVIGNLVFGTWFGFLYNCIGMLIGSAINFHLGRKYGEGFAKAFVSEEQYNRYIQKMNDADAFRKLLTVGFILPVFPDDLFCIISGMSDLTFKEFYKLVIFYRPVSLFVFTYAWAEIIRFVSSLLGV